MPIRRIFSHDAIHFDDALVVNQVAYERLKSFRRNLRWQARCDYTNSIRVARFVAELAAQFIRRACDRIPGSVARAARFLVELIERPIHGGLDARRSSSLFALAH